MKVQDIVLYFEKHHPSNTAYDWDNVGLQVGSIHQKVTKVLLTLDVTTASVKEAVDNDVDLIISHHPMIFRPLTNLQTDDYYGKMIQTLLKEDIALYVAHTNFDVTQNGMNEILANVLNLQDIEPLDIVKENYGIGCIGMIKETTIKAFIPFVKDALQIDFALLIGDENRLVNKVAITGGSGASEIKIASEKGVDLYITGDISYHHALDAYERKLNLLDVGHDIERLFTTPIKKRLEQAFSDVSFIISETNIRPHKLV